MVVLLLEDHVDVLYGCSLVFARIEAPDRALVFVVLLVFYLLVEVWDRADLERFRIRPEHKEVPARTEAAGPDRLVVSEDGKRLHVVDSGVYCRLYVTDDLERRVLLGFSQVLLVLAEHLPRLAKLIGLPWLLLDRRHVPLRVLLLRIRLLLRRLYLLYVIWLMLDLLHVADALSDLELLLGLLLSGWHVVVAAV